MLVLKNQPQAEIVVKRSRFISEMFPLSGTQEGAREFLRQRKEQWSGQGIRHLVHAFIVGPGANVFSCSDDGEPSGTAGRPVLEVLKGSGITNVMLTVARYFGGIKLGTGGLVKAYTESAQAVLALAETCELVPMLHFRVNAPFSCHERIKLLLVSVGATLDDISFGAKGVQFTGTMREEQYPNARQACLDASRGQADLELMA